MEIVMHDFVEQLREMLPRMCAIFVVGLFMVVVFGLLGWVLYAVGFKKCGHRMMAIYGASPRYLERRCPYGHQCSDCRIWTCAGYHANCRGLKDG